ncbi:MAG: L-seryl-tRNA(Sec) selenium transferase [Eubacteriales bacterium]
MNKNLLYRSIPKVDILLENQDIQELIVSYSRDTVMESIRIETELLRNLIGQCDDEALLQNRIGSLVEVIAERVIAMHKPNMTATINATGTILHTNLGRAPIGEKHMEHVARLATGYSNLEYNLEEGKRGERYAHFEELLCKITGAEAAMAVNNNAAAVMLILSAIGHGKEVVVSRGELVEVGGKFRIPDVMELSGATLIEVGTTNKTHLSDYEEVITADTAALLKVHTSNYRIIGFTETVPIEALVPLGREHEIPIIEDLGSGVLIDLSKYGLTYEPTVQDSIRNGADVVCFSGDKLFGGPQAGIIIGKKKYIDKMKKNQLTRALRIDKFTAATLEVVLQEYLSEEKAIQNIPVLHMMTKSIEEVTADAELLMEMMHKVQLNAEVRLEECESQIGGGSLPLERIKSKGIVLKPQNISTVEYEAKMRHLAVPIICRVVNDEILMDIRTVDCRNFQVIVEQLQKI